jgi:hypothetical protein
VTPPESAPVGAREVGPLGVLHSRPVILFTLDGELLDPDAALWAVLEALPVRQSYLVVGPTWTLEGEHLQQVLRPALERLQDRFGHFRVVVLASNAAEFEAVQRCGETPLLCSQGAFVSEDVFFPIPGTVRRFDAIYDAAWADYKRHFLAGQISSLALITYPNPDHCSTDYHARALSSVGHATWLNPPWAEKHRRLEANEVNEVYNTARVGLCLSSIEGIMRASVQYLLVGLPVVTTHSLGGRDVLFDPSYTRWVEDDPVDVAEAVAELVRLDIDPESIRRAALARIDKHRGRFVDWIRRTIEQDGGDPGRWRERWPPDLPNGLTSRTRVDDVVGKVSSG